MKTSPNLLKQPGKKLAPGPSALARFIEPVKSRVSGKPGSETSEARSKLREEWAVRERETEEAVPSDGVGLGLVGGCSQIRTGPNLGWVACWGKKREGGARA